MNSQQVRYLLITICDELGYQVDGPAFQRICNSPPPTVDRFTDVVMRADGVDPTLDKDHRRRIREIVAKHFDRWQSPPPDPGPETAA